MELIWSILSGSFCECLNKPAWLGEWDKMLGVEQSSGDRWIKGVVKHGSADWSGSSPWLCVLVSAHTLGPQMFILPCGVNGLGKRSKGRSLKGGESKILL